nr:hypothetical protein [Tanacetum cinerariifolium]
MDDHNITMKEYIRLEEERAHRHGKVYNWETATYGRIGNDDDVHDLRCIEIEFPSIIFNDKLTYEVALSCETTRHQYLSLEGLEYTDTDIADFEEVLERIYKRGVHRVHVFDFGGLTDLKAKGLSGRILMEHKDAQRKRQECEADPRQGDLSAYWVGISSARDFLGTAPSYTSIRDLMLRLCHKLIACSIAGRSHVHEKVIVTDLFYLKGMDVGLVNIPYLLARYLEMFASGRKRGAMISGG